MSRPSSATAGSLRVPRVVAKPNGEDVSTPLSPYRYTNSENLLDATAAASSKKKRGDQRRGSIGGTSSIGTAPLTPRSARARRRRSSGSRRGSQDSSRSSRAPSNRSGRRRYSAGSVVEPSPSSAVNAFQRAMQAAADTSIFSTSYDGSPTRNRLFSDAGGTAEFYSSVGADSDDSSGARRPKVLQARHAHNIQGDDGYDEDDYYYDDDDDYEEFEEFEEEEEDIDEEEEEQDTQPFFRDDTERRQQQQRSRKRQELASSPSSGDNNAKPLVHLAVPDEDQEHLHDHHHQLSHQQQQQHRGKGNRRHRRRRRHPRETLAERILRVEREEQFRLIDRAKVVARRLIRQSDRNDDSEEALMSRLAALSSNLQNRSDAIREKTSTLEEYRHAQAIRDVALFGRKRDGGGGISPSASDTVGGGGGDGDDPEGLPLTKTQSERILARFRTEAYFTVALPIVEEMLLPAVDAGIDEVEKRRAEHALEELDAINILEGQRREMQRIKSQSARNLWKIAKETALCYSDDPHLAQIRRKAMQRRKEEQQQERKKIAHELEVAERVMHEVQMRVDFEYRQRVLEQERRERNEARPKSVAEIRAEMQAELAREMAQEAAAREAERERHRALERARQQEEDEAERQAAMLESRIDSGFRKAAESQQQHFGSTTHASISGSPLRSTTSRSFSPSRSGRATFGASVSASGFPAGGVSTTSAASFSNTNSRQSPTSASASFNNNRRSLSPSHRISRTTTATSSSALHRSSHNSREQTPTATAAAAAAAGSSSPRKQRPLQQPHAHQHRHHHPLSGTSGGSGVSMTLSSSAAGAAGAGLDGVRRLRCAGGGGSTAAVTPVTPNLFTPKSVVLDTVDGMSTTSGGAPVLPSAAPLSNRSSNAINFNMRSSAPAAAAAAGGGAAAVRRMSEDLLRMNHSITSSLSAGID